MFLDAGPVVRARTGCALARTETSFQYVIDDGAWPRGERVRRTQSLWRPYQYYPLVSEEEFSRKTLKGVVSKYFDNSYLGVVSSLVREEKISVDDLRDLIRQIESQTEKR